VGLLSDFVSIVAEKKQQYRQNQDVHLPNFLRVGTLGYKNDTPTEFGRLEFGVFCIGFCCFNLKMFPELTLCFR
jgi:hypothetical protein